ncbi:MAG: hypothetical protein GKR93_17910 [Gammaproteobacteria bacterium]|nr:hypothetical protein [Gammaproteobacteria bacterium]
MLDRIENSRSTVIDAIVIFSLAVFCRITIESLTDGYTHQLPLDPYRFLHYFSSFTSIALSIIIISVVGINRNVVQAAKLILPSFFIILLPPFLDLTVFASMAPEYSYILTFSGAELWDRYLTFFGPVERVGITPGMRIEIGIASIAIGGYCWLRTQSLLRAFIVAWLTYTFIFVHMGLLFFILKFSQLIGVSANFSEHLLFMVYMVMIAVQFTILAWLSNRYYFKAIIYDSRFLRLAHFELLMILGYVFAPKSEIDPIYPFPLVLAFIAIWLAWLHAVMVNNYHDIELDRINSPERPLVKDSISIPDYLKISRLIIFSCLAFAFASGFSSLIFICIFLMIYQVYSSPPLRAKRWPFISKLFISINCLATFMIGFHLGGGQFWHCSPLFLLLFLFVFFLGTQFIDLKDEAGDRAAGINTIATIFGLRKAQYINGIGFALFFIGISIILSFDSWLGLSYLAAAGLFLYFFTRQPYKESKVFVVYIGVLIGLVIYAINPPKGQLGPSAWMEIQSQWRDSVFVSEFKED